MLCTQVKTHNFTDIGQKKRFQAAGGNPVIKNTYLAAIEEEKKMIIYTMCIYTENYDVTVAASNGFFILFINNVSLDLSMRARISVIRI